MLMKKGLLLVILLFAFGSAINVINEDFESGVFPPQWWAIMNQGDAYEMGWELDHDSSLNNYAYGIVRCTDYQHGISTLYSNFFTLQKGEYCNVSFDNWLYWGVTPNNSIVYVKVNLINNNDILWTHEFNECLGWQHYTDTTNEVPTTSNLYRLNWVIDAYNNYGYQDMMVTLRIDNVLVNSEAGSSKVNPISLGYIKTLYR